VRELEHIIERAVLLHDLAGYRLRKREE
jgi:transcriptional regulator with GAF, ATPase, and Fis domain